MRINVKENCEDGSYIGIYMICSLILEWNGKKKICYFFFKIIVKMKLEIESFRIVLKRKIILIKIKILV